MTVFDMFNSFATDCYMDVLELPADYEILM
jgi:hypothetical protein